MKTLKRYVLVENKNGYFCGSFATLTEASEKINEFLFKDREDLWSCMNWVMVGKFKKHKVTDFHIVDLRNHQFYIMEHSFMHKIKTCKPVRW